MARYERLLVVDHHPKSCEIAGTLPLERPPGAALAWETLSAQDKARRPGHAVTDAKRE